MPSKEKGSLYLIPTTLGDTVEPARVLPAYNFGVLHSLRVFVVEQLRTARRFLKRAGHPVPIDDMQFFVLNKHTDKAEMAEFLKPAEQGTPMGLLSEAGTPCVADPGAVIVAMAHRKGIRVVPMVGPNSIILALMASGFNGQQFAFHGYLPVDGAALGKKIKNLEEQASRYGQTQIFIETPYRNGKLLENLLKFCKPSTRLCLATDLSLPTETIRTRTVAEWKKHRPDFHKKPTVFLLSAG